MIVTLDTKDILDAIKSELPITKEEEDSIFENLNLKYQMCISSMPATGCTEQMRKAFWKINIGEITKAIAYDRLREWCETTRENLSQCLVDVMNTLCAKESENDG